MFIGVLQKYRMRMLSVIKEATRRTSQQGRILFNASSLHACKFDLIMLYMYLLKTC
ncbi:unnamed protein product, partial [Vitis vinifera]|uniref:Uncharacterized protein n=1 Tax=Vitis vinifera TaxID=29760 RepID=D7U413_VITVI